MKDEKNYRQGLGHKAQEMLEVVLAKNPVFLNKTEKAVLKARRDYLSPEEKKKFASVLAKKVVAKVQAKVAPPKKK